MTDLNKKSFGGFVFLLLVIGLSLFLPVGTLNYLQAWVFLSVFALSILAITMYLMKKDRKLLERRVRGGPSAEQTKTQQIIQLLAGIAFLGIFVLSSLDHRFRWSQLPIYVVVVGEVLIAAGFLIVFFVFRENTFASATIEVAANQKVISTGPYSLVRHPMYSGALVMLLGVPVALGSWWGLCMVVPLVLVIIVRLFNEEKFLAKNLEGYMEYRDQVRYRLVPFVW